MGRSGYPLAGLLLFDIGNKSLALPQVRPPRIDDGYPRPAALRRWIIGRLWQIDNAATITGLVINGQSRAVQLNSEWLGKQCNQAAYNCAPIGLKTAVIQRELVTSKRLGY